MAATDPDTLPDGSQLAALDIGSNSFHLIVGRIEHGEVRPSQVLAEKVQLGAGLEGNRLSAEAIQRGLDCLSRFSQMLQSVEPRRLRVVGTNALRRAKNRREFTEPAREILGAPVEVIFGREEARLVYLGVAHTLADDSAARLVVDIGGGSTEFIVGERFEPRRLESLQLGCVSYTSRHFDGGTIDRREYQKAYERARVEVSHIRKGFRSRHWRECVGSSGTLRAIEAIVTGEGFSEGGITRKGLTRLRKQLLRHKHVGKLTFSGLSDSRRPVIAAGIAITEAIFDELDIEHMRTSNGALREGVLYDLVGRLRHEDVRERSISAMQQRYAAEPEHAELVASRARVLFEATRDGWGLGAEDGELLDRAARTHEIGMAISHKHFHRHGAYLLRNSDLPGFSQGEQEQLALLVAGHRGKLKGELFDEIDGGERGRLERLVAIMRLATLFKYVDGLPDLRATAEKNSLHLEFPADWLVEHPLTLQELDQEKRTFERLELALEFR